MMRPSLSVIISTVFMLFILHSIYNLVTLYRTPTCNAGDHCLTSYLNSKPNLELLVYLSDNARSGDPKQILHVDPFQYEEPFDRRITIEVSRNARNNGSLYIHTVVVPKRRNAHALQLHEARSVNEATYAKGKLTKHVVPQSATFNLLHDEKVRQTVKPVTHLKSKYAVTMITDELSIPYKSIPYELMNYMRVDRTNRFMPILTQDFMRTRLKDLVEVTADSDKMEFTYSYAPTGIGKFKFLVQMESTFVNFMSLGFTDKDVDEVKGVFVDTNLYLLCATMVVGGLHLLLDFLSFKNDVSFWKSHKSMAGLSIRTVLWRSFSQTIVFLYLLDEGTSLLVLIPSGVGMLIEFWKVTKVFKITISWTGFQFNRNVVETEAERKTKKYDEESMKYISYLLYPLIVCAAVYSLIYQPHKSWYSWTISSMVNGVYVFGFIFMLPQLFINYRLKSVAALPWRAFTYRAFNTFIDDIFAFIITMPTAHRLACFRDDIVFLIYLYQRWLYPVDETRTDDASGEPISYQDKDSDKKTN